MSGKQPFGIISSAVVVLAIMLMSKPTSLAAKPSPTTRPSAMHLPTPPKGDGDQKVLTMARTELGRVQPGRRGRPANQPPDLTTLAVRPLTTMYAIDYDSLADGKGLEAAKPRNLFVYAAVLNGQVRGIGHVQITGDTTGAVSGFDIGGDGPVWLNYPNYHIVESWSSLHDVPDLGQFNARVVVDHAMAKRNDLQPRQFRVRGTEFL
jgi:hypothetical protein